MEPSSSSSSIKNTAVWKEMQDDYISSTSIQTIHENPELTKIPVLIVMVHSTRHAGEGHLRGVFKDASGTMEGYINQGAVKEYDGLFRRGAGIILRNVSIVWLGHPVRHPYLNIVPQAITKVYKARNDLESTASFSKENNNSTTGTTSTTTTNQWDWRNDTIEQSPNNITTSQNDVCNDNETFDDEDW